MSDRTADSRRRASSGTSLVVPLLALALILVAALTFWLLRVESGSGPASVPRADDGSDASTGNPSSDPSPPREPASVAVAERRLQGPTLVEATGNFRARYGDVWTRPLREPRRVTGTPLQASSGDSSEWLAVEPDSGFSTALAERDARLVGLWHRLEPGGTAEQPVASTWFKLLRRDGSMFEGVGVPDALIGRALDPQLGHVRDESVDADQHSWKASSGLLQYRPFPRERDRRDRVLQYSYRMQGDDHLVLLDREGEAETWIRVRRL